MRVLLVTAVLAAPASAQTCPGHFQPSLQMPQSTQSLKDVLCVEQLPSGDMVVGGRGSGPLIYLYAQQSATWSAMGSLYPSENPTRILALETDGQGRIYAGGDRFIVGTGVNAPRTSLARFDPQSGAWALIPQTPTMVTGSTIYALTRTANGDIIAAGAVSFLGSDGTRGSAARFNPTSGAWTVIPTGTGNSPIMSVLELPNGDLVLAGAAQRIGTAASNCVARFETATGTWHAMGLGLNGGSVQTLKLLPSGDILAGGDFLSADGAPAYRVARYSFTTNTWTPVGAGLGGPSYFPYASVTDALPLSNGDIIVSGWLSVGSTWGLAKYSAAANAWLELPGMYYYSEKITLLRNGDLAIGCYQRSTNPGTIAVFSMGFSGDFNNDGDFGTDQDIEAFFACLGGHCCPTCPPDCDVNGDGDVGTDQDIEAFFRVLGGGNC